MTNRTLRFTFALSFLAFAPAMSAQIPVDWHSLANEGIHILSDYLRINTTNPPGNELDAARFLKAILEREGIEAQILDTAELGPNRANLYARLRGNGAKRAIALVHHMDVVPATPSSWSVDPFSGAIKDGYIWGRGAIDMKGTGVAQLMAMIAIKRSGLPLTRDIVYIGNSDEELTSTGEADILAETDGERRAIPRVTSDEAEPGSTTRHGSLQDLAVRDSSACYARRRQVLSRHRTRLSRAAEKLALQRQLGAPESCRAAMDSQRRVVERVPEEYDISHGARRLEQDQRHTRRRDS